MMKIIKIILTIIVTIAFLAESTGVNSAFCASRCTLRPASTAHGPAGDGQSDSQFSRREFCKEVLTGAAKGTGILLAFIVLTTTPHDRKKMQRDDAAKEKLSVPDPTPGIPFGFYDMGSEELPVEFREAGQKVYRAMARILIYEKTDFGDVCVNSGSGVVISPDGHIMVAHHVVKESISMDNLYIVVEIPVLENDSVIIYKRYLNAKIIPELGDDKIEINIIKVESDKPLFCVRPEAVEPNPGDKMVLFGYPRGTKRCYVSAGDIRRSEAVARDFELKHSADSKGGHSGAAIFVIGADNNIYFAGISTGHIGKYLPYKDIMEHGDIAKEIMEQLMRLKADTPEERKSILSDVNFFEDIYDNLNPNKGGVASYGFATKLSAYLATKGGVKLSSRAYEYPSLKPFDRPRFTLTKRILFTQGHENEANTLKQVLIAQGPELAPILAKRGIYHIQISGYNTIIRDTLFLSYDRKDPMQKMVHLFKMEDKILELQSYCKLYGFNLGVDREVVNTDTIEPILAQIKDNARVIGQRLRLMKLKNISLSNHSNIERYFSTLLVNYETPDLMQNIEQTFTYAVLTEILEQTNKKLARYGCQVYDIEPDCKRERMKRLKTNWLLLEIKYKARAISKLLKKKGINKIVIGHSNRVDGDKIIIHFDSFGDPIGAIKDALKKKRETGPSSKNFEKLTIGAVAGLFTQHKHNTVIETAA